MTGASWVRFQCGANIFGIGGTAKLCTEQVKAVLGNCRPAREIIGATQLRNATKRRPGDTRVRAKSSVKKPERLGNCAERPARHWQAVATSQAQIESESTITEMAVKKFKEAFRKEEVEMKYNILFATR